jgi:hypothetical protein
MSRFGTNIKLSVDHARQDTVQRFYEEGLGCRRQSPRADLDMFTFADGGSVGVFYVAADVALPDSAWEVAPWLEFLVEDPEATAARLVEVGGVRIDFADRSHPYLLAPGGPIFRLAKG